MKQNVKYELDYWRQTGIRIGIVPYYRYLTAFGIRPEDLHGKRALDVGCGYWGGMAAVLSPVCDVLAVDTLADEYRNLGSKARITKGHAEDLPCSDGRIDVAFLCNALDHCESPAEACTRRGT